MSKKSKIFTYGTGKRKIGHSKFDMGFTNTYSQGFGALNPVAVYETLPDDYWNVGSDGVTLLKPLAAPAFSDIKNHLYAFHVRNSAIWSHWNDFITNGTAFSDVYGSNASNQAADNPWEVPSINARYFQDLAKIGSGFGFPYFACTITYDSSKETVFDAFLDGSGISFNNISSYHNVTDILTIFVNSRKFEDGQFGAPNSRSGASEIRRLINDSLVFALISKDSGGSLVLTMIFAAVPSLGSYILSVIQGSVPLSGNIPRVMNDPIGKDDSQGSLGELDPHVANEKTFRFGFMCDDSASRCKKSLSPFVISQVSYFTNENTYKTYRFVRRTGVSEFQIFHDLNVSSSGYHLVRAVDTNFTGRQVVFLAVAGNWENLTLGSSNVFDPGYDYTTDFHWTVPFSFMNSVMIRSYSQAEYYVTSLLSSCPSWFGVSRPIEEMFACPTNQYPSGLANYIMNDNNFLILPTLDNGLNPALEHEYNSAKSLGYDAAGFCIYLCRNSYQLLDNLGYPAAALATRSYVYYRYQDFNALPLFAYSKSWEKFFRNTVVSSPELDYSKTNGKILFDLQLRTYLADQTNFSVPDELPERYKGVNISDLPLNSWVIPFENIPLNGMLNEGLEVATVNSKKLVAQLSGHHNQLVLRNHRDVFMLLSGYGLDYLVLTKMYQIFKAQTANNGFTYYTFSELFSKNFYLPNYYNGLCHLKYQNFNKDYFTSAMLDPMSGANSVAIGSTITENRTAEVKQSWFERIAQQRSVKGFMEAIFGITPTLDNKEPSFLGSTHVGINIGEVIQTSSSTPESPQGQRVGIGGARGGSSLVHGHINEHGWIIILSSFTVESQYHQGLQKQLNVLDSYMDYPTVDFAHIGNESILMKELNFDGSPIHPYTSWPLNFPADKLFTVSFFDHKGEVLYGYGNPMRVAESNSSLASFPQTTEVSSYLLNSYEFRGLRNVAKSTGTSLDNVFGYIPRYSSYKFKLDECHGEFLDEFEFWHTFRHFYGMPILSHEFVNWELCVDDNEFNRIFAVNTDDDNKFMCQTRFNASVDRALPYVCVPQSK